MPPATPEPAARPLRVREDPAVRRQAILEAAARLFATHGFADTTVRDIGDEVAIKSGSLYHYFASKDAILEAVLREFLADLGTATAAIVSAGTSPRRQVTDLVRHAFTLMGERPYWVLTYQNEFLRLAGQPGFEFVAGESARIEAAWVAALTASAEAGDFAVDVPVAVRYRLVRDATWTAVRWYRPGEELDAAALAERYVAVFYGNHAAG
ncbi:TetR family transcriptional regulator [Pimelobacter simplex]|uniref:Transcriptional regulator, TetR family n=1 Tax=Nocardioides simplex TaxID=2045 RepID=A0A0A1DU66_NOCSI|nr:TetR/AcrR family transcriptional regulator [Pimelobacter simplex]AIY20157.2 Transcriptional regulator, TetR family [Pimelobacter simplex]MCG8149118.1 TetR family transcriptional regulator [Pimelobacter simplex]GEB14921.1 HTH-type transcriptional repressor KstR2 [Pimelobacter simplex]SFM23376.1 transcriptional regulator, TetR family [Pimelobacter simplex]